MRYRCNGVNNKDYHYYGGRGITVCDRWNDFLNFKEDMYESYLEHVEKYGEHDTSIDRIDVNGNYCPENCKWSTKKDQANNRRSNHKINICNKTYTLAELEELTGISQKLFYTK